MKHMNEKHIHILIKVPLKRQDRSYEFMKEINLASVIAVKRKEKKITQDELANYLGVSKAAISKWETAQSYPDITLLPHIATYFDITIDELIGYEPQMESTEIKKLYHKLSHQFAKEPFDIVYERCNEIIKKYYSCFPLLLQMGILLLNYSMLAGEPEITQKVIEQDKQLFERIKAETDDVHVAKQALYLEAYCCLIQNDPAEVLVLLEGTDTLSMSNRGLFAQAYYMMGNIPKAKEKIQMQLYENIGEIFGAFPMLFTLNVDNPAKLDECVNRAMELDKAFTVRRFHPAIVITMLLSAAGTYASINNKEKTLELLQEYAKVSASGIFPLKLHGDDFFDMVDEALENFDLGTEMVRSEETVKQSMLQGVIQNPAFQQYSDDARYKKAVKLLESIQSTNVSK